MKDAPGINAYYKALILRHGVDEAQKYFKPFHSFDHVAFDSLTKAERDQYCKEIEQIVMDLGTSGSFSLKDLENYTTKLRKVLKCGEYSG